MAWRCWAGWVLGLLLLSGCGREKLYQQESYVFGTRVQVTIWGLDEDVARQHADAALRELDRLHVELQAWQSPLAPTASASQVAGAAAKIPSPLMAMNAAFAAGQPQEVNAELSGLLKQAQDYARRSDQLFNPAIGHLIEIWGFHRDTYAPVIPDEARITALLAEQPSMDDVDFDGAKVKSRNPAVAVDLGGFAKGWALDRLATYFRSKRVNNVLINIGGNVMALGKKGDEPWKVGLQHPRQPQPMAVIALRDGEAIGTSGDYQRFFEKDGKRYSHLIDPRSGHPAQKLQAATVITAPSLQAGTFSDVATKPIFIGGPATAMTYAERFGIKDVLLVAADGSVYLSPTMQERVQWLVKPEHIYRLR